MTSLTKEAGLAAFDLKHYYGRIDLRGIQSSNCS